MEKINKISDKIDNKIKFNDNSANQYKKVAKKLKINIITTLYCTFKDDIIYSIHAYNIETSIIGGYPFEKLYRRKGSRNCQLHN